MQVPPQPSVTPQRTPGGQSGMHTHRRVIGSQSEPAAHRVPRPQAGPPGHALGTSIPHSTRLGSVVQWGTHEHDPPVQEESAGHALPQAPQWLFSLWVLTQRSPQRVPVPGQVQTPAVQVVSAGQRLSQAPQWLRLV